MELIRSFGGVGARLAGYEAQIDSLSTELMEARSSAISLKKALGDGGGRGTQSPSSLQRQVALHRAKEERLVAQAAELEVLLEHRTKQVHAAEARASDLETVARNAETQNAKLR